MVNNFAPQPIPNAQPFSWDMLQPIPNAQPFSGDLTDYARQAANQFGLDPDAFVRQIQQESGFNPNAVSPSGAQGIAQFMPGTAASVGLTNPFDPIQSINAMARLMSQYQSQYGSLENALVAYNAGPGAVGGQLPQETQNYLHSITGTIGGKQKGADAEFMSGVVEAITAAQPSPADFQDEYMTGLNGEQVLVESGHDKYNQAISDWMGTLQSAVSLKQSMQESDAGIFRLDDGSIITEDQMNQLDPGARAQVQATIQNQNIARDNQFNDLLNSLNLTEFTTEQNSAQMENSRRSQDFQNNLESYREGLGLDVANQDTAMKKIDRNLSGMAEARSRASTAMDALMKAAPFGTSNGKTSFTPADLGGAVSKLAQFGGIGANQPLLNFTGTQTVDPNSMFNFYDQQLGVGGPLPEVPNLTTQPGQIPQAPGSVPIQLGSPSFTRPQAPVPVPLPQATPIPFPQIGGQLMQNILKMYGGLVGR